MVKKKIHHHDSFSLQLHDFQKKKKKGIPNCGRQRVIIMIIMSIMILMILIIMMMIRRFLRKYKMRHPHQPVVVIKNRWDLYLETKWMSHVVAQKRHWNFEKEVKQRHPLEFSSSSLYCVSFLEVEKMKSHPPSSMIVQYIHDLYTVWDSLPSHYKTPERRIVWYPHDRVERFEFPILVKSRVIRRQDVDDGKLFPWGSILFKLNSTRHFADMENVFGKDVTTFSQKSPIVFWRGTPTGYGFGNNIPFRSQSRETLVQKWALDSPSWCDIGLVFTHKQRPQYEKYHIYEKSFVSKTQCLTYKYLVSVEGNDVASNLKWMMASNSVVMMPSPQIESWFLESQLVPYVHYIPLQDDFSDIENQYHWAEAHPQECEAIIRQCHEYIQSFLSSSQEWNRQRSILQWYLDSFEWSVKNNDDEEE